MGAPAARRTAEPRKRSTHRPGHQGRRQADPWRRTRPRPEGVLMFKRTVQRYGNTPEPITPYQKAAQLWDERIGSSRVQARNWRVMAFGSPAVLSGVGG